jgi:hypothetical protein
MADQLNAATPFPVVLTESAGSVCWFLMDGCWMWGVSWALYLAVPTILLHGLAAWHSRRNPADLMVWLATLSWLGMNVAWVVSDLAKMPWMMAGAKACFLAGGAFILAALALHGGALTRFRRLRIGRER